MRIFKVQLISDSEPHYKQKTIRRETISPQQQQNFVAAWEHRERIRKYRDIEGVKNSVRGREGNILKKKRKEEGYELSR